MLLALAGGYLLARHALRPVARLTEAARRITAPDLSVRLRSNARFRDEMTDLAETFNRMIARLESSFQRERRFTADAAHEIKNPLAALRNEAEVTLRRDRDPDAYRSALETILTDARRLGTLVDQLLELAHIEADAGAGPVATDVLRLGTEAVERWQQRAPSHRIGLAPGCTGPVRLSVHPAHLTTVLDNLLENALKYTPEGGRAELGILQEGNEAVLSVTDTGIGLDPETTPRLFDRFYRADTPAVQAQPGSGLGLAIAQAIVHHYGGTLAVNSAGPGRGSTFEVRFPNPPT
jgi:signal transduction histidine kinase